MVTASITQVYSLQVAVLGAGPLDAAEGGHYTYYGYTYYGAGACLDAAEGGKRDGGDAAGDQEELLV